MKDWYWIYCGLWRIRRIGTGFVLDCIGRTDTGSELDFREYGGLVLSM